MRRVDFEAVNGPTFETSKGSTVVKRVEALELSRNTCDVATLPR